MKQVAKYKFLTEVILQPVCKKRYLSLQNISILYLVAKIAYIEASLSALFTKY